MLVKELIEKVRTAKLLSDISMQRSIVYDQTKQALVIDSIVNDIPLPAFYLWEKDGHIFEVLDGKQRIEALKNFFENALEYKGHFYTDWCLIDKSLIEKIENTALTMIICRGDDALRREIFYRINAFGVPLNNFEIINGLLDNDYIRELIQFTKDNKLVKKVLGDINNRGSFEYYLLKYLTKKKSPTDIVAIIKKKHHFDEDASFLVPIFKWVDELAFKKGNKIIDLDLWMKLAPSYLKYKSILKDKKVVIHEALKAYYETLKTFKVSTKDKETYLIALFDKYINGLEIDNKRYFTLDDKLKLFNASKNENDASKCQNCLNYFYVSDLEVDHIIPWSKGGKTTLDNAQLLCKSCNVKKSNKN